MSILEESWGRSIETVSHHATKFRHSGRLSCCDGHGLRISTVNPDDEPLWEEELAHPSFAVVFMQAEVFRPPRFRLTSTRARRFHHFGRAAALQLRGSSSCVDRFRSGAMMRCKKSNRNKTDGAMGFRRARTACDWLVLHRYYGVYYGNTLKRRFRYSFCRFRLNKTERSLACT